MKNCSISVLLLMLLVASTLLITGCPGVRNRLPTLIKISGPSGTISQSSTTFIWNGSDPDGTITTYEFRKDGISWETNGLSSSYEWSGYKEGVHTFDVRAKDNENAYSNIISWTFTYENTSFSKCLGGSDYDEAHSIWQTSDGGYIIAGYTNSNDGDVSGNHGRGDYWIVKLDRKGNIIWQKCLGGSDYDEAQSIQQTSDGGFIVAGSTWSNNGDVTGKHGSSEEFDYWIVKLNGTGNIAWQKCLGGSADDVAFSIQQTADAGFIVAGVTSSNNGDVTGKYGGTDYWIVKLDSTGNITWQKCLGGSADDAAFSIQQTADTGFIVAGVTSSNNGDVTGNHGGTDCWIVKLSNTGYIQWRKCLGGSHNDWALSIQQTSDSGFIVAGYTRSNNGDVTGNHGESDYWIVKFEAE